MGSIDNRLKSNPQLQKTYPTRLTDNRLRVARFTYLLILVLVLGVFLAGIPHRFRFLGTAPIGVLLRQEQSGVIVLEPLPNHPADRAGVIPGDVLIGIEGTPVSESSRLGYVQQLLVGPPGSQISIEIRRSTGETRQITIQRDAFPLEKFDISAMTYALILMTVGIVFVLGFSIPALIIYIARSEDWLAMFASLTLVLTAVFNSTSYGQAAFIPDAVIYGIAMAYHLAVPLVLYLFPDGRFVPRWTRTFLGVAIAWAVIKVLPFSFSFSWTSTPWTIVIDLLIYATGIYAQIYRYRNTTDPTTKQQTKWITFGIVIAYLAQYAFYLPPRFIPALLLPDARLTFNLIGSTVNHVVMLFLPFAFTHAVLRRRLYDIDLIINRTLVYVPLSAIVAGIYTASVTLFKSLFVTLTGETSDVGIVLATLIIVALITPLKDRLQKSVDKRFKDSSPLEKVLSNFEAQVQSRLNTVDPAAILCRLLEKSVEATRASGGVAYVMKKGTLRQFYTAESWEGTAALNIRVARQGRIFGEISLGPRQRGTVFSQKELEALHQAADVVARAIDEDLNL
jgi:hypothetical protein